MNIPALTTSTFYHSKKYQKNNELGVYTAEREEERERKTEIEMIRKMKRYRERV